MKRKRIGLLIDSHENNEVKDLYFQNEEDKKTNSVKINAFILAFWNRNKKDSFHIELWQKDFFTQEMKQLCVGTIFKIGELVERSTNDKVLAEEIKAFAKGLKDRMKS